MTTTRLSVLTAHALTRLQPKAKGAKGAAPAGGIDDGGSKHLHGISQQGIRATTEDGAHTIQVETRDAAVANFGALTAYSSPVNTTADTPYVCCR